MTRHNFAGLVLGGPAAGRWQIMDSPFLYVALAPELTKPHTVETEVCVPLREARYKYDEITTRGPDGREHKHGFWVEPTDHGRPERILDMLVAGYHRPPSQGV